MNIQIKRPIPYNDRSDNVRWDLQMRSNYIRLISSFVVGAIFIAIYFYTNGFDILESIGAILIALSIISFVGIFKARNRYMYRYQKVKKIPMNICTELNITLQDSLFKYETAEIKQELKWTVFQNYKIVSDMLFLLSDDNYLNAYVIYKDELSEKEFLELHNFLSKFLLEKK